MIEADEAQLKLRVMLKKHIAKMLQHMGKLPLHFIVDETITAMIKEFEEYKNGSN